MSLDLPLAQLRPRTQLNSQQKAAVIVRLLLAEGATLPLARLPDGLQTRLTEEMGALRLVDRDTLRTVAAEFLSELESVGMAFSGGVEGALAILEGAISPETAGRLRSEIGQSGPSDPWDSIAALDTEDLAPVLERESVEVGAVLLSKLSVAKAAALLGQIPGERARRITYAMSMTANVAPTSVARIGTAVAAQFDTKPATAFSTGPVERVGAILNLSGAQTRDSVLDGLQETDADFANQVRRTIFTFAHIPARVDPRDIPKALRGLDQPVLVTAIVAARASGLGEAGDFILGNTSKRMAEQIEEEVAERGAVKEADGEAAMNAVVAQIRQLEEAGEITLIAEEEPES